MDFICILPFAAWVLFLFFLKNSGLGWRIAFLSTSVLWGISVTLLTELLSFFTVLNLPYIALGWTVLALVAGVLFLRKRFITNMQPNPTIPRLDKLIVVVICSVLTCTFIIAIVSPPNNWDSLTYRMTRIMFWIQQETVAHFPTNNLRQIELSPWAEFAIMHFELLSGGDSLSNLIQWFSMVGCIVGVSLISRMFSATLRGQLISGLLVATTPMAILQASSTQNDLVVSFWLVCFIAFGIKSTNEKSLVWCVLMSCSLALAILTKGTAYIYASPFVLWFILQDVKKSWVSAALKYLLVVGIVFFVNLGHFQRNYYLFHNPIQSGNYIYHNGRLSPSVILSNISRNVAIHLIFPSDKVNCFLKDNLNSLHNAIGISSGDPETTWSGTTPESLHFTIHEDQSGNIIQMFLFFATVPILAIKRKLKCIMPYALTVVAGFLLFCTLLRWQPWASRLHLPFFMLFSPIISVISSEPRKTWITCSLVLLLYITSLPYVFYNRSRPIIALPQYPQSIFSVQRRMLYFIKEPYRGIASLATIETIKNGTFRNIGVSSGDDSCEYPLWALTRERGLAGPRIEHVDVQNVSRTIARPPFNPDIIVVIAKDGNVKLNMPQYSIDALPR